MYEIEEKTEELRGKSNEELIYLYGKLMINHCPSPTILSALNIVIEEREIKIGNMIIGLIYKDSDGENKVIQIACV